MIIGVVREALPGESRVAATPATVKLLLGLGYDVVVDPAAGLASSFTSWKPVSQPRGSLQRRDTSN